MTQLRRSCQGDDSLKVRKRPIRIELPRGKRHPESSQLGLVGLGVLSPGNEAALPQLLQSNAARLRQIPDRVVQHASNELHDVASQFVVRPTKEFIEKRDVCETTPEEDDQMLAQLRVDAFSVERSGGDTTRDRLHGAFVIGAEGAQGRVVWRTPRYVGGPHDTAIRLERLRRKQRWVAILDPHLVKKQKPRKPPAIHGVDSQ